jgi:hypothetical protein
MKSMKIQKLAWTVITILLACSAASWAAGISKEKSAAQKALYDRLAVVSSEYAAVVEAYAQAGKALGKDKENPELKAATQTAMKNLFSARGVEMKKYLAVDAELQALDAKVKETP